MMKKKVSQTVLEYRNRFFEIYHVHVDFADHAKDYHIVELGPRAGVVALQGNKVLLTRQYRFLLDRYCWEIPGGRVDVGETPIVAAERECLEETGYRCADLQPLVEYYPGLDNFNNRTSVFASRTVERVREFTQDPAEVVEVKWFPVEEAMGMVLSGEILDGLSVVGLLAQALPSLRMSDSGPRESGQDI